MKKVIKPFLIVFGVLILLLLGDYIILKLTKTGPIFSLKKEENGYVIRKSFLYDVYRCDSSNPKDYVIKFSNQSYDCDLHDLGDMEYIIVDETENCASAMEEIYRDDLFVYYFPCIKSETVFIKYANGNKVSIKKAIEEELMPFLDLYQEIKDLVFVSVINNE